MPNKPHFCIYCGAVLPQQAKFCPDCGKAVEAAVPAVEKPVSDNPIVAGAPALLGDKKKLRALLAVVGVLLVLILAIALIAGGGDKHPSAPPAPPVADDSQTAQNDADLQEDGDNIDAVDKSDVPNKSDEPDRKDEVEEPEESPVKDGPWLLPDPRRIDGYHFELKPDYTDVAFYTSFTAGDEAMVEEYVATLEALGYKVVDTEYEEFGSAGDVQKWYLLHENVSREGEEGVSGSVYLKLLRFADNHYMEFTITFSGGISVDGHSTEKSTSSSGDDFFDKADCGYCHGRGTCSTCGGSGQVQKYQHGIGWDWYDCSHCSMGECRFCGGSGDA